ncbi:MAG: RtcB family protein [Caldilineaceae bacterium]
MVALMADHHIGYALPIGGVAAYGEHISPSGVGYDISCGNKAVLLDLPASEVRPFIKTIMDDIWRTISFGMGRKNAEEVEHELFEDDPAWDISVVRKLSRITDCALFNGSWRWPCDVAHTGRREKTLAQW